MEGDFSRLAGVAHRDSASSVRHPAAVSWSAPTTPSVVVSVHSCTNARAQTGAHLHTRMSVCVCLCLSLFVSDFDDESSVSLFYSIKCTLIWTLFVRNIQHYYDMPILKNSSQLNGNNFICVQSISLHPNSH